MSKINLAIVGVVLIAVSLSCKSFMPGKSAKTTSGPPIDFTTPAKGVDVKVELDKKQSASGKISAGGGSVALTATDGSKFTLEVPANAVETETDITITAVKSIEGAGLNSSTPMAVQLEPSGLKFKEIATLTITPAKEIPIKNQIIFGYESDGKDYHLAPVDPNSKEIKIKLMRFSGAGVGSGSDAEWAAHLRIQASDASTRLLQKFAETTQTERMAQLLRGESKTTAEIMEPFFNDFYDQVVLKEIAAAELDCKHAQKALDDLIFLERMRQLLGGVGSAAGSPGFAENERRLLEIGGRCKKSYRVSGQSNNVSFTGEICSLNKPFTIDAKYPGGTAKTTFTPGGEDAGSTSVNGGGGGCEHSGGGEYTVTLKNDGSGTLVWTTSDTIACPRFGNSRTATFTLSLQPAPDLACP
jgi:hypothetical protein